MYLFILFMLRQLYMKPQPIAVQLSCNLVFIIPIILIINCIYTEKSALWRNVRVWRMSGTTRLQHPRPLFCLVPPLFSAVGEKRLRMSIRTGRPASVGDLDKGVRVQMRDIQNAAKKSFLFSIKLKSLLVKPLFLFFLISSVQVFRQTLPWVWASL